jgi:hypothetical protein
MDRAFESENRVVLLSASGVPNAERCRFPPLLKKTVLGNMGRIARYWDFSL